MKQNQPRQKAPHTRHFDKSLVPDEMRREVVRLNRNIIDTAALLGVSVGSAEELKNIGGALKPVVIEHVRQRLAELAGGRAAE